VEKPKIGGIVDFHRAIERTGDEESISGRVVENSLRLGEIGNRVRLLAGLEIDDFQRVVFNRGDEQALPSYVHAHVIDPPFDIWQRDARFQRQRLGILSDSWTAQNEES
jgi:hypothetical protein